MSISLSRATIAHFESVFRGPNGDYPALLEVLVGIEAEDAAWKPHPSCNSIWQIIDHITASNDWLTEMLTSGHATASSWIQPTGDGAAWAALIDRLQNSHARLLKAVEDLEEDRLMVAPEAEPESTHLEQILSIAAHEAFHVGQVDYLKGLRMAVVEPR